MEIHRFRSRFAANNRFNRKSKYKIHSSTLDWFADTCCIISLTVWTQTKSDRVFFTTFYLELDR